MRAAVAARLPAGAAALAAGLLVATMPACHADRPPVVQNPVSPSPTSPAPDSPAPAPPPVPAPPPPAPDAVLVAAGDIGECGSAGPEQTAALLDAIPGTVMTLGDHAYMNGSASEFQRCYHPTWGRHLARTRATPGNHDYGTPDASGYFDYFGERAGPAGLGYYSFDLGAWHVISLNSTLSSGAASAQLHWLRADLQQTRAECVLATWHHPLYSSGPNGDSPWMRDAFRVLHDARAEVVLAAHDHLYERQQPISADGRPDPQGIRSFIVGTGGARLYTSGGSPRSMTEVKVAEWGVLKLTLSAGRYSWEFVTRGGVRDSGSDRCR